jgi:hypothetical protein
MFVCNAAEFGPSRFSHLWAVAINGYLSSYKLTSLLEVCNKTKLAARCLAPSRTLPELAEEEVTGSDLLCSGLHWLFWLRLQ